MPLGAWSHGGGREGCPHVPTQTLRSCAGEARMGLVLSPGHIWTWALLPGGGWPAGRGTNPAGIQMESVTQLCCCSYCLVLGLSLGQLVPGA